MDAILIDVVGTVAPFSLISRLDDDFAQHGLVAIVMAEGTLQQTVDRIKRKHGFSTGWEVYHHVLGQLKAGSLEHDYIALEGLVNAKGNESRGLKSFFYPDTAPALMRWKGTGMRVSVYTDGLPSPAECLFRFSEQGDLTPYVERFFGTDDGRLKTDPDSYRNIADQIRTSPKGIMYVSDTVADLDAAATAGCEVRRIVRPDAKPLPENGYVRIATLTEIC
ncbi:HAD-IA family hydrolase [Candidatus Woesearchaeota archaeon]|nr:HAD-IA family hydrolase [Candidatus Woesearchaeota archaeon]